MRRILWGGWLSQFVFCLIGFHWVAYTAHEFGRMPWPLAVAVLLLFCAFGHLFFVLAGL
ncbi:MAG: apolipoprotein N-acyltransferase, partial [Verrucomicrobiota bacterium]